MKLVGERRALAAAILVFYAGVYLLTALSGVLPPEWTKAFSAMGAVYGVSFFALVAGYFWARWFSMGVALSGLISGAVSLWQLGPEPVILVFAGSHLATVMFLWGEAMAAPFDGQQAWRQRFHIDDNAAHRLGRAVIRAGVSLPYVLLYALAPKPASSTLESVLAVGAAGLAIGGVWAMVRMRTWGILSLAGAAGLCAMAAFEPNLNATVNGVDGSLNIGAAAAVAAIALSGAVIPFFRPAVRFLAGR
jgi:hypothetical protein